MLRARTTALTEAHEAANQMCRSALTIAERMGDAVDWERFAKNLRASIDLSHEIKNMALPPAPPAEDLPIV